MAKNLISISEIEPRHPLLYLLCDFAYALLKFSPAYLVPAKIFNQIFTFVDFLIFSANQGFFDRNKKINSELKTGPKHFVHKCIIS